MMSQFGPQHQDFVFDAASFAVFEATEKLLVDDFDKTISEVVLALPYLIEAIVHGLVKLRGLTVEVADRLRVLSTSYVTCS